MGEVRAKGRAFPGGLPAASEGGARLGEGDAPSRPVLTVVTVVLNGGSLVRATLDSVLALPMEGVESVVIDGGSVDGTVELLKAYGDRLAYWVSAPDAGIYDAMNRGIQLARGRWILFLNAGDTLLPAAMGIRDFDERRHAIVHGYTRLTGGPFEYEERQRIRYAKDWCVGRNVFHQSIFYSSAFIEPYDLSYRLIADRELTTRMLLRSKLPPGYLDATVCTYDINGVSARALRRITLEYVRLCWKYHYVSGLLRLVLRFPFEWLYPRLNGSSLYRVYRSLKARMRRG